MNMSKKQRILAGIFASLSAFAMCPSPSFGKVQTPDAVNLPEVTVIQQEKKLEALLKKHKIVVLFMDMRGCPYCKRFSPKFNQLASQHKHQGAFFAKIKRKDAAILCRQYGIKKFPTVLIFQEGVLKEQFQGCSEQPVHFFVDKINALST